MVAYLANLQYLHIEKPQGYSTDAAQKIAEETSVSSGGEENHTDKTDMEDQPNILGRLHAVLAVPEKEYRPRQSLCFGKGRKYGKYRV